MNRDFQPLTIEALNAAAETLMSLMTTQDLPTTKEFMTPKAMLSVMAVVAFCKLAAVDLKERAAGVAEAGTILQRRQQ